MKPFLVSALARSRRSPAQGYLRDKTLRPLQPTWIIFILEDLCLSFLCDCNSTESRRFRILMSAQTKTRLHLQLQGLKKADGKALDLHACPPTNSQLWSQTLNDDKPSSDSG